MEINMRKGLHILAAAVLTLLLVGCSKADFSAQYDMTETDTGWEVQLENLQVDMESGCLESSEDRNLAVYQLQTAEKNALEFLGDAEAANKTIRCRFLAGDGLTQCTDGQIDIYYYATLPQPLTNLMIQVMAGTEAPDWLREGLGACGADRMGESLLDSYAACLEELEDRRTDRQASEASISVLAADLYRKDVEKEALQLGDMMEGISRQKDAQAAERFRGAYCIYAGSFVDYLIDEHGMESVMRVYRGADFDDEMHTTWEKARESWIEERLTE